MQQRVGNRLFYKQGRTFIMGGGGGKGRTVHCASDLDEMSVKAFFCKPFQRAF